MERMRHLLDGLTAGDVMGRAVTRIPSRMSLRAAVRLFLEKRVRAAPVTNGMGQCIGVLSVTNILRWVSHLGREESEGMPPPPCVWAEWQILDPASVEEDEVRRHMTPNPLLVPPSTRLVEIVGVVLASSPRPVVVVDQGGRPIGLVSSGDILAALAMTRGRSKEASPALRPAGQRAQPRRSAQPSESA